MLHEYVFAYVTPVDRVIPNAGAAALAAMNPIPKDRIVPTNLDAIVLISISESSHLAEQYILG